MRKRAVGRAGVLCEPHVLPLVIAYSIAVALVTLRYSLVIIVLTRERARIPDPPRPPFQCWTAPVHSSPLAYWPTLKRGVRGTGEALAGGKVRRERFRPYTHSGRWVGG